MDVDGLRLLSQAERNMDSHTLTAAQLAARIEQQMLKPDTSTADIENLCTQAREFGFRSVCVNGAWVDQAHALLEDTQIKVTCAVGFPLGGMSSDAKRFEAEAAIDDGAQEIDLVINVGRLKDGNDKYVLREMRDVVEAADERPVGIILECSLLTEEEKLRACELVLDSGAQSIKTGTGFKGVTTLADLKLLRETLGAKFGITASGPTDTATSLAMIVAGASRLGTAEGVRIVRGIKSAAQP